MLNWNSRVTCLERRLMLKFGLQTTKYTIINNLCSAYYGNCKRDTVRICCRGPMLRRPAPVAVDRYAARGAPSSKPAARHCCSRSMGQTDRRTGTRPLSRPCSACYVDSVTNQSLLHPASNCMTQRMIWLWSVIPKSAERPVKRCTSWDGTRRIDSVGGADIASLPVHCINADARISVTLCFATNGATKLAVL